MDEEAALLGDGSLRLVVPLSNRLKASAIIVVVFLACVLVATVSGSRVVFAVAALCLPIMMVQLVEPFCGASLEIGADGVRTVDAFGRIKYFGFSECSPFDVWTMQGRNRIQLVVFDYTGAETTGLFSKRNKSYSGYNASVKAAFGWSATAMAALLNRNRLDALD